MPVKYIGRESHFHGKSLYEIARNLKNFGEGRYVYRVAFNKNYKEPSFYKLTSVVPDMNAKGYCKGTAAGERVFRGVNYGVTKIDSGTKLDWRLIPKDQEQTWLDSLKDIVVNPPKVLESTARLPPVMEMIVRDELISEGIKVGEEIKYDVLINTSKYNRAVLDKDIKTSPKEPVRET